MRRETIEAVGLLDENIFAYGEDNDYCERLRRQGKKIGIALGVYVHHDHHKTANSFDGDWVRRQQNKSRQYLAEKWGKAPALK